MPSTETRFVIVKPGEVLVIANVGPLRYGVPDLLGALKEDLGLAHVLVFEGDVDLSAIPASSLPANAVPAEQKEDHGLQ
jgi:hypothetical protein